MTFMIGKTGKENMKKLFETDEFQYCPIQCVTAGWTDKQLYDPLSELGHIAIDASSPNWGNLNQPWFADLPLNHTPGTGEGADYSCIGEQVLSDLRGSKR